MHEIQIILHTLRLLHEKALALSKNLYTQNKHTKITKVNYVVNCERNTYEVCSMCVVCVC